VSRATLSARRAMMSTIMLAWFVAPVWAQGKLVGYGTSSVGVVFERWGLGDGIAQPVHDGSSTVVVENVSQLSLPITARVPLGQQWTFDFAAAYSTGRVELAAPDPALSTTRYELDGITDARIRATGHLTSTVSLTLGLNVPLGRTSLDSAETQAFRVLAAPPFSFQTARLGSGFAASAGVVLSRQLGAVWAGALGASYEMRGDYEPGAVIPALLSSDYSPGDALRLSAGLDGLLGQHGLTLGLSLDVYPNSDQITDPALEAGALTSQLGPVITTDVQLRIATRGLKELTIYAADRYRTSFSAGRLATGNRTVPESSGNYLDLGIRAVIAAGRGTGILVVPNFRHQTGLDSDNTLATAGIVSGAMTVTLIREIGAAYVLQPFVRGQVGRLESGGEETTATAFAGGVTAGIRF